MAIKALKVDFWLNMRIIYVFLICFTFHITYSALYMVYQPWTFLAILHSISCFVFKCKWLLQMIGITCWSSISKLRAELKRSLCIDDILTSTLVFKFSDFILNRHHWRRFIVMIFMWVYCSFWVLENNRPSKFVFWFLRWIESITFRPIRSKLNSLFNIVLVYLFSVWFSWDWWRKFCNFFLKRINSLMGQFLNFIKAIFNKIFQF